MAEERKCSESGCSGNCEGCAKAPHTKADFLEPANPGSAVKRIIGVVSGKGGVGKSTVTSMLAVLENRKGYNVGILDADITGPSIPKLFGIHTKAKSDGENIYPESSHNDIKIMSINLMLDKPDSPVIWRGPVIGGAVKQFWTDVVWGDLDFLFIDMPPGTGDVPLTVFQSIPIDGIVIVTSPQDLVSMIVKKAYNMARQMDIPVLGIVENMSYVECPDCGKKIHIFGRSRVEETAKELGVPLLGRMPINPTLAGLGDKGEFERFVSHCLDDAADRLEQ